MRKGLEKGCKKIVVYITLLALMIQPIAPVLANPKIDAAGNGVPIVEINNPGKGGISYNPFDKFDVNKQGLIFNNSQKITNTTLAGYIMGNKNLLNGPARLILAEVIGNNPSKLNGYMEIAGQRAGLIIANPNGIIGDGFGFINANKVTLTTGNPIFKENGDLSYHINKGNIQINGQGLDATQTEKIEILSKAVEINAGIWGNEINITAGSNKIDQNGNISSKTEASASMEEKFAIDISALGGMYAGKIKLIGTEKGLGVNNGGTIQTTGDFTLDSQGKLKQTGVVIAGGNAKIKVADNIKNENNIIVKGELQLKAEKTVENSGNIIGQNDLVIIAGQRIQNRGTIAGEQALQIKTTKLENQKGDIEAKEIGVEAEQIHNGENGRMIHLGGEQMKITAKDELYNEGMIGANSEIKIEGAHLNNRGNVYGKTLKIQTKTMENNQGKIESAEKLKIEAQTIGNTGGIFGAEIEMAAQESIENKGVILSETSSRLTAKNIRSNGTMQSGFGEKRNGQKGGSLIVQASEEAVATGNNLADKNIEITGAKVDLNGSKTLANQAITIVSGSEAKTEKALIQANEAVQIKAGALANKGGEIAGDQVRIDVISIDNNGGKIINYGEQDLTIKAKAAIDNKEGTIAGKNALKINAGKIENQKGNIEAASIEISALSLHNGEKGQIAGLGREAMRLEITEGFSNQGSISTEGNLVIGARAMNSQMGQISAKGDVKIDAETVAYGTDSGLFGQRVEIKAKETINNQGSIIAETSLSLDAQKIVNGGTVQAGFDAQGSANQSGNLSMNAEEIDLSASKNLAAGNIALKGSSVNLNGAKVAANNDININAKKEIDATSAVISTGRKAYIETENLTNKAGEITAEAVKLSTKNLNNYGGKIIQYGEENLDISVENTIDNENGEIAANAKELNLAAREINNRGGSILQAGEGTVKISASEKINNSAGKIQGAKIEIKAEDMANEKGKIIAAKDSVITISERLNNEEGTIAGQNGLTISAGKVENKAGNIEAGKIGITVKELQNGEKGQISSLGKETMHLTVKEKLDNEGIIGTNGDLEINVKTLVNKEGKISAKGDGNINAETVSNEKNGGLFGKNIEIKVKESLNNQGAIIAETEMKLDGKKVISNGTLQAGFNAEGQESETGNLSMRAEEIDLSGSKNLAAGNIGISGSAINLNEAKVAANNDINIVAAQGVTTEKAEVAANGKLKTAAADINNKGGKLTAGKVELTADNIDNKEGTISQTGEEEAVIAVKGKIDNTEGTIAVNANKFILNAKILQNQKGKIMQAGKESAEIEAEKLTNEAGQIMVNGCLNIKATDIDNGSGDLISQEDMNITAKEYISVKGTAQAKKNLTIESTNVINQKDAKIIGVEGEVKIAVQGTLTNEGTIAGGEKLTIQAKELANKHQLFSQGDVRVNAETLDNEAGAGINGQKITLKAEQIKNSATIIASQDMTIQAKKINADQGIIAAGIDEQGQVKKQGGLSITGEQIRLKSETIAADIKISGQTLDMSGGTVYAKNQLAITSSDKLDTEGAKITAEGTADIIAGGEINNAKGRIEAGEIKLTAKELNNQEGKIYQQESKNTIINIAGKMNNNQGEIITNAEQAEIKAGEITNQSGKILHTGKENLHLSAGNILDNTKGELQSNGAYEIQAVNLKNQNGTITAVKELTMTINQNIENNQGEIVAGGNAEIIAGETIKNNAGNITANQAMTIKAKQLQNESNGVIAGYGQNGLSVIVDKSLKNEGSLISGGQTAINTESLINQGGKISAEQTINIQIKDIENSGQIAAGKDIAITAKESINSSGDLIAGKDIALEAKNITTTGTIGAGIKEDGSAENQGSIKVNSQDNANLKGKNIAGKDIEITAGKIDLGAATTYAKGEINLKANTLKQEKGNLVAKENLEITIQNELSNEGYIEAKNISIDAGYNPPFSLGKTGTNRDNPGRRVLSGLMGLFCG